jgi:hypothetical protein
MLVTPDVQVIGPSQKRAGPDFRSLEHLATATVLGVRQLTVLRATKSTSFSRAGVSVKLPAAMSPSPLATSEIRTSWATGSM